MDTVADSVRISGRLINKAIVKSLNLLRFGLQWRYGFWHYLGMANHIHVCGGTILAGGSGEQEHQYCDRCAAYTHDIESDLLPDGIDQAKNTAAWDAGYMQSPDHLMTAAQISEHVAQSGLAAKAFWGEASGGDMMSMPRAAVDAVLATMIEGR